MKYPLLANRENLNWNEDEYICSICYSIYKYFCDEDCSMSNGICDKRYHSMAECPNCVTKRMMLEKING